jgi:hypothetical protein
MHDCRRQEENQNTLKEMLNSVWIGVLNFQLRNSHCMPIPAHHILDFVDLFLMSDDGEKL